MKSIWQQNQPLRRFPALSGDTKTDILIIGGGIAGILTALHLKQSGADCIIAEKGGICQSTTAHATAKLSIQHRLIYHRILERYGKAAAQKYYYLNQRALNKYCKLCPKLDCDFAYQDSYVYSVDDPRVLEKELDALRRIGCSASYSDCSALPFPTAGAVRIEHQAMFDPVKFVNAVCKDLKIFERTPVLGLEDNTAVTPRGRITAKVVIVTTHFPILNRRGLYALKLYQHRSYILALENAPIPDGMYVDDREDGLSFRRCGDLLLLCGGGHRTGKQGGGVRALREFANIHYPLSRERMWWAAQDCMSLDAMPYIGRYSPAVPNLYVAAGFNKWGFTSAMAAGMILRDLILQKKNNLADVFDPSRSMLKPQLIVNGLQATADYLNPFPRRCTHLGCALHYNRAEHSWDCPCHGSRFAPDGRVLDPPAVKPLKRQ